MRKIYFSSSSDSIFNRKGRNLFHKVPILWKNRDGTMTSKCVLIYIRTHFIVGLDIYLDTEHAIVKKLIRFVPIYQNKTILVGYVLLPGKSSVKVFSNKTSILFTTDETNKDVGFSLLYTVDAMFIVGNTSNTTSIVVNGSREIYPNDQWS